MSPRASQASYRVRLLPLAHQLEVELRLSGLPAGPLALQVPTWVPGAYGFMKYGRDVFGVEAWRPDTGAPLQVVREGWSGYRLEGAEGEAVVRYRAGAFDPAWGELAGLVDHESAVLLGTRYLQAPAHTGPVRVTYVLPEGWPLHHPADARPLGEGTFEYPGYAALLDTPVVAGRFTRLTRACHGVPFHHVFLDAAVGFASEVEGFIEQVMAVAQGCHDVFGAFPFPDYTFVYSFDPTAHWGLEHASATMIGLGPEALIDAEERARGVRVAAHELFHAWNVCRLKPQALLQPDFARGCFPAELWVSEGVTRYYEFLLSVRAGALPPEALFSNVLHYHRQLTALPAFARVSPADSSRATFLNHNRYPGAANSTIDYYDAGMLVAFDLDATLRTAPVPTTLDRELAAFYAAHVHTGFTNATFRDFFCRRTPQAAEVLDHEVEAPGALSTLQQLERLGFEVRLCPRRVLGLLLEKDAGPRVADVLDTLPAGQSGLAAGDELLEVEGHPFSLKALRWLAAREEAVRLTVRRGGRTLTFCVPTTQVREPAALVWRGSEAQAALLRGWLGRPDFRLVPGESLPLTRHENFHGVQTVL